MNGRFVGRLVLLLLLQLACATTLYAQATRTWVSGVGDDANPCSRTAPCKTWAGAISKTASPGEIDALDPGGFGAVTITKSISLVGAGTNASTLSSGVQGIVVSAQPTDVVTIRNLSITGAGVTLGTNGINFISGGTLNIENCDISEYSGVGILIGPSSGTSKVTVINSSLRTIGGGAIHANPSGTGAVNMTVSNTVMRFSLYGLRADGSSKVAIYNSVANSNTNNGFVASGSTAEITIDGGSSALNGTGGINVDTSAKARFSNMQIYGNGTGLLNAGGSLISFGNNRVAGNGTDVSGVVTTIGQM